MEIYGGFQDEMEGRKLVAQGNLKSMFTNYIDQDSVFRNKDALTTNWKPEEILHREEQINDLASILAPSLRGDDPSNVFIYGSVGTGKCVHPGTKILTSKGPKTISSLFQDLNIERKVRKNGEEIIKPESSIEVVSYSEDMEQEINEVTAFYRQEAPDSIVHLRTSSGREVKCTENHSFMRIDDEGSVDFYTAKQLETDDYVAVPKTNCVDSTVDSREGDFMSGLSRFIGYLVGDGGIHDRGDYRISITNSSKQIRDEFSRLADELFGVEAHERNKKERTDRVVFSSKQVYSMLDELGSETDVKAGGKQIPNFVFGLAKPHKAEFLSALIDTDGYVSKKQSEMVYTTKSEELASQLTYLLTDFDIAARISEKEVDNDTFYRVKVSGADAFRKLLEQGVDLRKSHKQERIERFAEKEPNTNTDLLPNVGGKIRSARISLGLHAQDVEPDTPSTVYYYEKEEAYISKKKLEEYVYSFKERRKRLKELFDRKSFENARQLRELIKYEWKELGQEIDEKPANIRYAVKNNSGRINEFRQQFIDLVYSRTGEILEESENKIEFLEKLTKDSLVWDKITSKQKIEPEADYVYDIEVENNHNYICGRGGLVSHNTLVTKHVTGQLGEVAEEEEVDLNVVYINCKMKKAAQTEYRLLAKLAGELGDEVPSTGLPTDEVYNRFFEALKQQKGVVIIALDEIDALVKKVGDEFLYNLTRINDDLDETKVSIIGISNDLNFTEYMDSRVKSSLSEEEIIFPPYNAIQLREILKARAEKGFVDNALKDGVISKCSALAAQEHGDARRALDLIRVAGELSERSENPKVEKEHVDLAQDKIERDRVVETVRSQPKHSKLVLYTILDMTEDEDEIATGDVYSEYKELCKEVDVSSLTQRRVSGLISELDMLGVINAKVISKGRYGRTRQISVDLSENIRSQIEELVEEKFYL